MTEDPQFKKVLQGFELRCARQEMCSADVRRKALRSFEGDADRADALVRSLVENGYVDDARYAAAFAREKSRLTGWGPVKITFQLRGKGLSEEAIRQALQEGDAGEAPGKLHALLSAKYKSVQGEPDARLRLIRFALGRGYEWAAVSEALKGIL